MNAQPASVTRLRVLLVQDGAAEAELTLDALRRAGFDPQSHRVETEREFLEHLTPDLDVILADHTLRRFNAARALELANERGCRVPFIILSGTAGEDIAVAAMRQGAADYLLKDRLARLGESVVLAMESTAAIDGERRAHEAYIANAVASAIERERIEKELLASNERTRFALEAARMGIWELDLRTRRVNWSETMASILGCQPGAFDGSEEAFFDLVHVDDRDAIRQAIERSIVERQDFFVAFRAVGPDGVARWIESRGRVRCDPEGVPMRIVGADTDVTERKLLETQLRQAQKMEALGQLAGGIAHDFNNLLTAILGYSRFAADALAPGDQRRLDIDQVTKAAERASGLTKQLLAFSRKQVLRSTPVDLNVLVSGVGQMLGLLIGEHIEIEVMLAPDLALVRADAGELEQVVINLAVNAGDAMGQGGRLTLETANVQLHAASGPPGQAVIPGWYVMLAVIDRGVGMDENTKQHIFEPFFTTKELGKGTGLGLAIAHGIVKQSDGYIWVDSVPGRGSAFKVYLPRGERPVEAASGPGFRSSHQGSETVLVVEDEAGVRNLARRILEDAGYHVLEAANGRDAEMIFAQNRDSIELLITDVIMPRLNGPDLFRRLVAEKPGLKVVYISGYATEAMVRQVGLDRSQPCIQKPFTADQLASTVRSVLDGLRLQRA